MGRRSEPRPESSTAPNLEIRKARVVEYLVVEKKAKGFLGGRMKPVDLEKLLNDHASDGWELDRILDGEGYASLDIARDVFYVIFKRGSSDT